MIDLGTLGPDYTDSQAEAINSRGDVVGSSINDQDADDPRFRATLWTRKQKSQR